MAKLPIDKYAKGRIDNLLIYPLGDIMVLRNVSGFTKETRTADPKYKNCTRSASEFGRVSSLCKHFRLALYGILPKQNNWAMTNALTKKMREVLECDTTNAKGERTLANALATEQGKHLLNGYNFNPDGAIKLDCTLQNNSITIVPQDIPFPKGITQIGFRLHQLAFDFETAENVLVSGDWIFGSEAVELMIPELPEHKGVMFTIVEAQFYERVDGELVPMEQDGKKGVVVVGVG